MRNRIIRPHNMIAQLMLDGNQVTPEQIREHFKDDARMTKLMYKLSGYISDIRKYDNGIVKVTKDGRKVTSYQLANADLFDSKGFYTGVSRVAQGAMASQEENVNESVETEETVSEPSVEVPMTSNEVTEQPSV